MILELESPVKCINPIYKKDGINETDFNRFKDQLNEYLSNTKKAIDTNENEGHIVGILSSFLKSTHYSENYINTKKLKGNSEIDLAIYLDKKKKDVGVIIEAKLPSNVREMLSEKNVASKALCEAIHYYLYEKILNKNNDIKHIIVTSYYKWYVFDATTFHSLFYENSKLKKQFNNWSSGLTDSSSTKQMYENIGGLLNESDKTIATTYFDLENFDLNNTKQLIALYKFLSPRHLLKEETVADSNSLDKNFYHELLHVIGLEEVKEKSKKVITRSKKRELGSLLENTIVKIQSRGVLRRMANAKDFGDTEEEQVFNLALELCLTWVNRILFLKLLESQLISYHNGNKEYAFLNVKRIEDFDQLETLFFEVLAVPTKDRGAHTVTDYPNIPYLNSSLFDPTVFEEKAVYISGLKDNLPLSLYPKSVLKNETKKELPTLEYLLRFLDAYDFGVVGKQGDFKEENKTLISASVLGLIFEKINGYKEGSFYTPSFITMYMCKETLRRTVIQKTNEAFNWSCTDWLELQNSLESKHIKRANEVINSITICDPAVGSGHFLVSALNEMIAIKADLGVLADENGKKLKGYSVQIDNDELIITDEDDEPFDYGFTEKGKIPAEVHRIQKTIFYEKKTIIENCLFGVDINPNSVKICQLRLWIELLKNTYYTEDSNYTELETLPNIDINIKCGNSLISQFGLKDNLKSIFKNKKYSVESYKQKVLQYKQEKDKNVKKELDDYLKEIKEQFQTTSLFNKQKREIATVRGKIDLMNNTDIFGEQKVDKKELKQLETKLKTLETNRDQLKNNAIYKNAFEWRFEFPEVLNKDGDYLGFDCVIGNPPYVLLQNLPNGEEIYLKNNFNTASYKGDLFGLFIELSHYITNIKGTNSVIVSYTWMSIKQHTELRKFVLKNGLIGIIDLPEKVFDSADLDTTIILIDKSSVGRNSLKIGNVTDNKISITGQTDINYIKKYDNHHINIHVFKRDIPILDKIQKISVPLENIFNISQGYIPYRRSDLIKEYGIEKGNAIVDNRLWHSNKQINNDFKQEIQGRDISKYFYQESYQYVKYGKHLAGFVDPKYFINPRVLIMEITRGAVYKIKAAYLEKEFYNTPSIINVIHPENDTYKLKTLLGILNSKLATWYHLKKHSKAQLKTSIPKILVSETRKFPVCLGSRNTSGLINKNIDLILKNNKIDSVLESEIDQLVYQLYDLTPEEIEIVESSVN